MRQHVDALGVHPDGDVAFQQDAFAVQGFYRLAQLHVAMVLQEVVDLCAVAVAPGAVLGIVGQPVLVVEAELQVVLVVFQGFPLLLESPPEIDPLGSQHFGVVDDRAIIETVLLGSQSEVLFDAQPL